MSKRRQNRREFLGLAGISAAGLAGARFPASTIFAATESPDADPYHAELVVFNAKVYTMDSHAPKAEPPRSSSISALGAERQPLNVLSHHSLNAASFFAR